MVFPYGAAEAANAGHYLQKQPSLHHQLASTDSISLTQVMKNVSFELNHKEYGLPQSVLVNPIDIQFHPSEYGILDHYSVVKEIYRVQLSPTIITLTTHNETNMVRRALDICSNTNCVYKSN